MPSKRYVNEDEPLYPVTPAAQPAFTSTGLQLEVRGKLFEGFEVGLSNIVDDTTDEGMINERLDMMRRIFERQRMVFEHREAMAELVNKTVLLKKLPDMVREYTERRAHEHAAELAKMQIRHNRERRGEFKMSNAQVSWNDQFNDETEKKLKEFQGYLDTYPAEVANLKERIERCKRVFDGTEKTDLLSDMLDYKEAAE